jgi:hypothetical protein
MPFLAEGDTIVSKHPSKIQLELISQGRSFYVPVKALTWEKSTETIGEHHSGSEQVSNLTDGYIDYKLTFETGTWVTTTPEDAAMWEYLTMEYLVMPFDEGRSREFNIHIHEAEYVIDGTSNEQSGGGVIVSFRRCKLTRTAYNQGENGTVKRTFEAMAMRLSWGGTEEERGGQG